MATRFTSWFTGPKIDEEDDWQETPDDQGEAREVRPFKPQGINYLLMCKPWSPIFVPPEDDLGESPHQ